MTALAGVSLGDKKSVDSGCFSWAPRNEHNCDWLIVCKNTPSVAGHTHTLCSHSARVLSGFCNGNWQQAARLFFFLSRSTMDSPLGGQAHSQADTVPSTPALPSQACSPPMTGQAGGNIGPGGASPPNSGSHTTSVPFPMNHGPHNLNINNNNILACKMQAVKSSTYSSPPPMPSNPENNVCKLIEYRGAKVAAFVVDGQELICLPQAFELFLKHLVGGLHTVYTKLKRLDIVPVVCNVEQVRILRGLGAIQPGVNRCKLLSCKDFDVLYEDCTNSR